MQEDVRLPPHAALLLSIHGEVFEASGTMQAVQHWTKLSSAVSRVVDGPTKISTLCCPPPICWISTM